MSETCGMHIKGFPGLKSKIYSFIREENNKSKIVNSVNNNVVDD